MKAFSSFFLFKTCQGLKILGNATKEKRILKQNRTKQTNKKAQEENEKSEYVGLCYETTDTTGEHITWGQERTF